MTAGPWLGRLVVMTNDTIHSIRTGTNPFVRRGAAVLACAAVVAGAGVSALANPAAAAPATHPSVATAPDGNGRATNPGRGVLDPTARKVVEAGAVGYLTHVRDGKRVHTAKAGLADLRTKRPIGVDDQFEAGSNTKTFTSVIVLQLVAQGRLSLDDPIEKHLPGVVPNGDGITVRQLLNHTSGIFSYTADKPFMELVEHGSPRVWTPIELVEVALQHEPDFEPGTSWNYSNTNYILAGLIAEKVSGQSLATLIEQRITRPLGLRRTFLVADHLKYTGPGVAHGYYADFSGEKPVYDDVTNWPIGGWAGAAGAVVSTPSELATFFSAVLGGRLVPAKQMNEMRTFVTPPKEWQAMGVAGYGLGLMKYKSSCGTVFGHGGDTNGHHSTAVGSADGRKVAITDTTTQPRAATPSAEKMMEASAAAADAATCLMLGKPVPATS